MTFLDINYIEWLKGKKTYVLSFLSALVVLSWYFGLLDEKSSAVLLGLLGSGSISTMAAKVNRMK